MNAFSEVLLLLFISVSLIALFRRLRLAAILAYLLTGMIAGPSALDFLSDAHQIAIIAELGIVFLFFLWG